MTASRILVVDDEADIRGMLKEILADEGYEVEVAADAARGPNLPDGTCAGSRASRHLDARHGRHHAVARMVGDRRLRLSGGDDVRTWNGRNGGRGDAPRRLRFRGEAALAHQAPAHRGAGARCRPPQALVRAGQGLGAGGADRQEQAHAGAARTGAAGRRELLSRAPHRRAGFRARGLCALSAFAFRALLQAFLHGRGGESRRGSRGGPLRQRARRQGGARRARSGRGRLALSQRARGPAQRGAAGAPRGDRAK